MREVGEVLRGLAPHHAVDKVCFSLTLLVGVVAVNCQPKLPHGRTGLRVPKLYVGYQPADQYCLINHY
jgi:hypothetical protein